MKSIIRSIYIPLSLFLISCGGGGGDSSGNNNPPPPPPPPAVLQGQFVDAPVAGITYTSGGITNTTDASGLFSYEQGQTVTFSIGGIVLGTADGKTIVTPVDLVPGAVNSADPQVVNIVQFLLTIDEDLNPDNGIQISQAMINAAATLTVDFSAADFDTSISTVIDALAAVTMNTMRTLETEMNAQAHLDGSLFSILAGDYSGTYTGTDTGTWQLTVATDGSITGTGNSNSDGPFDITGSIDSSGDVTASGFAGTATWSGSVDPQTGNISGTWQAISFPAENGTFTGSKNNAYPFDFNGRTATSVITYSECPGVTAGFSYAYNTTGATLTGSDTWNEACTVGATEVINALYSDFPEYDCGPTCTFSELNKHLVGQVDGDGRTFNLDMQHVYGSNTISITKTITAPGNYSFHEVITFD